MCLYPYHHLTCRGLTSIKDIIALAAKQMILAKAAIKLVRTIPFIDLRHGTFTNARHNIIKASINPVVTGSTINDVTTSITSQDIIVR